MTLPTFLGIGAPRSGTKWLYDLLDSHLDVYVSQRRKEVRFFDKYYERGLSWYEEFFPSEAEANRYRAIGEFSPQYLYCPDCPARIASVPSITKLILILRNPIDRAYSHYGFMVRTRNYSESFETFLVHHSWAIKWGFYSQKIRDYLRYFSRDQILVLIFEHAVANAPETKDALAGFLGIAADLFPPAAGARQVNKSYVPRAQFAYDLSRRIAHHFQKGDMDWVVNLAIKLGLKRLFGNTGSLPPMKEETRQRLRDVYDSEIKEMELFLNRDLACWKS